ncbi:MAG: hypothetical protein XD58_0072 [Thermotoga sp. 50_1627]|uniref:hypothetical protein n=1 Tax=Pseudothermotoga sp. TaxID=2033661 RepID=UPI00076C7264|nr:MAG: hypothetical protein XD45_0061 [Thermotoga sp. 50_64]KUK25911.1 MAG: hypothetical protein XD58_0072 [Thermotoga sp. 50_1627]MBC7116107.1 hypothetical protein [Pseudothermotoga sp.]MDK2922796.1 hypothetical protein [Pseudothermotoga sp.]HBT38572.1 hypothetical protein [Pseudothermotoga sp.]
MRKLILLLLLVSTLLLGLTQFVPQNYDFLLLSRDNAKYYEQMKKVALFDTLINGLGIESMIQGVIASQLVKYGAKIDQFNELLSGQILLIQKDQDFFLAMGPGKETEKLAKAIADFLGKEIWVSAQKSYVVVSNNKDFANLCLKGGGTVPPEVYKRFEDPSVWAVGYSPELAYDEAEFESSLVIKVESDRVSGFLQWKARNDAAKAILSETRPDTSYQLHRDPNLSGEIFVFSNVQNARAVKTILEQVSSDLAGNVLGSLGQVFGISGDFGSTTEQILVLSEKASGKMAMSFGFSQFVQSLFETQSSTETVEPSFYAVMEAHVTPQEIAEALGRGEVSGDELRIDNFTVKCDGSHVRIFSNQKSSEKASLDKALKLFDPSRHSLFVFVDFAPIIEKLLGVTSQSAFVAVGTVSNDAYITEWNIK